MAVINGMASYIGSCTIVTSGVALVIYQQTYGLTDIQFGALSAVLTFCIGAAFAFEVALKVWMQERFPTLLRTTANGAIVFAAASAALRSASLLPSGASMASVTTPSRRKGLKPRRPGASMARPTAS